MNVKILSIFVLTNLLFTQASAHDWSSARADSHAPIGVMGDHTHASGEWMLSYRFMTMNMSELYQGTSTISPQEVTATDYMMSPVDMEMSMHMFGAMYAINNDWTLMFMLPMMENKMSMRTRMGMEFNTSSKGVGDIKMGSLYNLVATDNQKLHLNLNLSLPTGSVSEKTNTPMAMDVKMPYAMQLGSGSFGFLPGLTYLWQTEIWSGGAQLQGQFQLNENDEGYTLGNTFTSTIWGSRRFNDNISTSVRISRHNKNEIDGEDSDLNPMMSPTTNTINSGGNYMQAGLGINLFSTSGTLKGNRLALEYSQFFAHDLNGVQLGLENCLTLGWQLAL